MPSTLNKLTHKQVRDAKTPGRLSDGGGLYLQIGPRGGRSWLFIYRWLGRRPELGLGPYPQVGLADARRRAEEARALLAERPKRDPRAVWRQRSAEISQVPTFGEFAEEWLPTIVPSFKNQKHRQQWENTLKTYGAPVWRTPIDQVDTDAILTILNPIWNKKRETAQRVRGRIERVLDAARARGLRRDDNPARWRGHLSTILPNKKPQVRHFPAMDYADVPTFMESLVHRKAMSARCLQFIILTAVRSIEARGMVWDEVNLAERIWTIPPSRIKAEREHRVPLSPPAISLLRKALSVRRCNLVFPGQRPNKPLSETSFRSLFDRSNTDGITVHGFRSSFRDWCGETTSFPREVAEAALAHTIGDKTEQAYRRGDALEKRRQLMDAWAEHCTGGATTNVVALHA